MSQQIRRTHLVHELRIDHPTPGFLEGLGLDQDVGKESERKKEKER